MRRTSSLLLGWLAVGLSCSGRTEPPPPSDFDNCMSLCERYKSLDCTFAAQHVENGIADLTALHSSSCREYCSLYSSPPQIDPEWQACFRQNTAVIACAAKAGLRCLEELPDAPPVVIGCDQASREFAEACSSCVLLLSSGTTDCPEEKPMRWVCATAEPDLACYPACKEVVAGEFCCPDELGLTQCDPDAAPFCKDC